MYLCRKITRRFNFRGILEPSELSFTWTRPFGMHVTAISMKCPDNEEEKGSLLPQRPEAGEIQGDTRESVRKCFWFVLLALTNYNRKERGLRQLVKASSRSHGERHKPVSAPFLSIGLRRQYVCRSVSLIVRDVQPLRWRGVAFFRRFRVLKNGNVPRRTALDVMVN